MPSGDFNQECRTHKELKAFLKETGVTFTVLQLASVNGAAQHPLYAFLKKASGAAGKAIRWNFGSYFLVDPTGTQVTRHDDVTPLGLEPLIKSLMSAA